MYRWRLRNGVPITKPVAAGSPCSMGGTQCNGLGTCVAPVCTGKLGFPGGSPPSVDQGPIFVAAEDLNSDGTPDLVVKNSASSNVSVLINQGNGTFAPAVNYAAGLGPTSVKAADLNADGRPDLVVANSGGNNVSLLLNTCLP